MRVDASAFYPSIEEYYDQGNLPFLRVADVDSTIDFENCTHIPAELCERFPTLSRVRPGDIVFTKGGSVARIGLVTHEAAVSRDLIFLNSSHLPETDYYFLYLYFRTGFFNRMLVRSSSQTAQPHLTITLVRNLPVFTASDALKIKCVELLKNSGAEQGLAVQSLKDAEQILLQALGLDTWQPPEPLTYVRRASEVAAAGRFDSEFFAPRTLQLLAKLGAGGRTIRDVAPPRHEEFKAAGSAGEFDYIEIGSLRGDGTVGSERLPCVDAPSRATWHVREGDVVTSTVRPNRRLSALITPEQNGFVSSSGFVVLQPKAVPAEVLLTYLRLPPVCEVMDLHTSASLYPTISETDLLKLPFPKLDAKVCDQVTAAVRAAHTARREAQSLLARAQRAVEVAIEQGEPAALQLLTPLSSS